MVRGRVQGLKSGMLVWVADRDRSQGSCTGIEVRDRSQISCLGIEVRDRSQGCWYGVADRDGCQALFSDNLFRDRGKVLCEITCSGTVVRYCAR